MSARPSTPVPQVIVTPSTPMPPSPGPRLRSPAEGQHLMYTRSHSICEEAIPNEDLLSPPRRTLNHPPPKRRSAAVSILFLFLAAGLVLSSAFCASPSAPPHFDRLDQLSQAVDLRVRLALDLRQRRPVATKIRSLFWTNGPASALPRITGDEPTKAGGGEGLDNFWKSEVETAGPVLSTEAWEAYLKRREAITGTVVHGLEAWDFH